MEQREMECKMEEVEGRLRVRERTREGGWSCRRESERERGRQERQLRRKEHKRELQLLDIDRWLM